MTQVEDVDLYQRIPTMLRKDTDLDTQWQSAEEEEEEVVVEEEERKEERDAEGEISFSFKEQSASQPADGQGQEASEEEGTVGERGGEGEDVAARGSRGERWGGVTGALVPVRRGARPGQGGQMVSGGEGGGMVAVKANPNGLTNPNRLTNPNGWYPETWGSTLEAEMEVVIQMEHCGLVGFFFI
jgi:hypothetical protein